MFCLREASDNPGRVQKSSALDTCFFLTCLLSAMEDCAQAVFCNVLANQTLLCVADRPEHATMISSVLHVSLTSPK